MSFVVRINTRTMRSAVHTSVCACVNSNKPGYVNAFVEADSPDRAAEQFVLEQNTKERGLPRTTIAPCALLKMNVA